MPRSNTMLCDFQLWYLLACQCYNASECLVFSIYRVVYVCMPCRWWRRWRWAINVDTRSASELVRTYWDPLSTTKRATCNWREGA